VVFGLMMALAHFVVHSPEAVKALAIASVAAIVPLMPIILSRMEYRLNARSLEQRPVRVQQPAEFETLFELDQLDHVQPSSHGFKFFKPLGEGTGARRFFRRHLSDSYSGEVHVEKQDLDTVLGLLAQHGVRGTGQVDRTS